MIVYIYKLITNTGRLETHPVTKEYDYYETE